MGVKQSFKMNTQEACEQTRDTLFHIDCDVISKEKAQDLVDKMDRTLTQRTDCNITLCGLFPTRGKINRLISFIKKLNLTKTQSISFAFIYKLTHTLCFQSLWNRTA